MVEMDAATATKQQPLPPPVGPEVDLVSQQPAPPPTPPPPPSQPPAGPAIKVQDRSKLRANVVLELINSERDFVKHLKNVVEGYLHRARKRPEIFTAQQINTIFANIEQLYEFQRQFLEQLETCINWAEPARSQVGACFLSYEKGFSVYHHYCNNHPNATSELQDLYGKPMFRAFFEECRLRQNMIDISLDGFLLTPIQKICKYPLQLSELLKNTPQEHLDFEQVSAALETMRNCANLANERKRRIEALADVMSFQEKVDNWFGPKLVDTSSILVHSGEVSKMTSHTWSQGVHQLHLFDHLLLYSKRDLLKRNTLILKGRICMDTVTEISDADEYKARKSFKLYCSEQQKWFVFTTKSEREKDDWIQAFERERNLVESDETEGFRITSRELAIARRALLHRKRSRSARYRHQGGGGGGGGLGGHANGSAGGPGGRRAAGADTQLADQQELDDSSLMINRTLSLPSCIHPSHVMNFVEESRVVTSSTINGHNASALNSSSSPGSNSRGSPLASSARDLASGAHNGQSAHQAQAATAQTTWDSMPGDGAPPGPTNWLRKMGSKKLMRGQVYQINGHTGSHPHQHQQHAQPAPAGGFTPRIEEPPERDSGGQPPPTSPAFDLDAGALNFDELEKRHRDHMVSEQQARLHRLNNDLPPPAPLYPTRSLTPTPFSGSGGGGAPISSQHQANNSSSSSNFNNRPKSSPSHHLLLSHHQNQHNNHQHHHQPPHPPKSPTISRQNNEQQHRPLESRFKESLQLVAGEPTSQQQQQQRQADQPEARHCSPSQQTFETKLVLSSGRVVHVREDAV